MEFDVFDESIGTEGYYRYIESQAFMHSTETGFDFANYNATGNFYRKGSVFSRVRKINEEMLTKFTNRNIDIN